jgi:hypothetical protein
MDEQFSNALKDLCRSLAELWSLDSFKDSCWRVNKRECVKTTVSDNAVVLPFTNRPVRGHAGVQVKILENRSKNLIEYIDSLILDSINRPESYQPQELQNGLAKVRETIERMGSLIDRDPKLSYRLYGITGYKTYSPEEFREMQNRANWNPSIPYFFSVAKLLSKELAENDLQPSERGGFKGWNLVWRSLCEQLDELRMEDSFEYEVNIFLNGPLIDLEEDISIPNLLLQDSPIEILLGYATDETLEPLVDHKKHPALERINTVIKYRVTIPIEAVEEAYLTQYHNASIVAQLLLDSLRLCRPLGDIGVLAIEVLPLSFFAPLIRNTWANAFHDELARFEPRRFDFYPPSSPPLNNSDIEKVKDTVLAMLPLGGLKWHFAHAIKRFRNSIDKYSVDDPERLLEYAIALESL